MPRGLRIISFSWSSDGRKIVFSASNGRYRGSYADLYVVGADGRGRRRLTRTPEDDVHPVWSPNGKRIAFDRHNDGVNAVWVINANGSRPRRLTPGPDFGDPTWSRKGTKIAYGDRARRGSWLYVMNADGSRRRRVTRAATLSVASGPLFAWSPRSDRLAFLGGEGIWLINPDGRGRRLGIRGSGDDRLWEDLRWSPDGGALAFTSVEGDSEILVGAIRGGGLRRLTDNRDVADTQPTWSPDGKSLAFTRGRPFGGSTSHAPADIYVINADGSGERNLTNSEADESSPVWSPKR